jgi:hypothetical protein
MNRRAPRVGASLRQILHWGLANALKQKFDLENALARDKLGGEAGTLPFGSTVVNVREVVPGGLGRLAPLLLAVMTGGLGGAGVASWCMRHAPPWTMLPTAGTIPPAQPAEQRPALTAPPAAPGAAPPSDGGGQPAPASPVPTPKFLDGILEWEFQADEQPHAP